MFQSGSTFAMNLFKKGYTIKCSGIAMYFYPKYFHTVQTKHNDHIKFTYLIF